MNVKLALTCAAGVAILVPSIVLQVSSYWQVAVGRPEISAQPAGGFANVDRTFIDHSNAMASRANETGVFSNSTLLSQLVHPPPEFAPRENWTQPLFADFTIVGLPKAGTSQLYAILTSHPQMAPFHPTKKELCPRVWINNFVARACFLYGDRAQELQHAPERLTVNACLHYDMLEMLSVYSPPPVKKRFLFLFRDPPSWLWASYNYWAWRDLDADVSKMGRQTRPQQHHRSPELFHELILGGS